jgi:hypothetical protein
MRCAIVGCGTKQSDANNLGIEGSERVKRDEPGFVARERDLPSFPRHVKAQSNLSHFALHFTLHFNQNERPIDLILFHGRYA